MPVTTRWQTVQHHNGMSPFKQPLRVREPNLFSQQVAAQRATLLTSALNCFPVGKQKVAWARRSLTIPPRSGPNCAPDCSCEVAFQRRLTPRPSGALFFCPPDARSTKPPHQHYTEDFEEIAAQIGRNNGPKLQARLSGRSKDREDLDKGPAVRAS